MNYQLVNYNYYYWPKNYPYLCQYYDPGPVRIFMTNCDVSNCTAQEKCNLSKLSLMFYQNYLEAYRNMLKNQGQEEELKKLQDLCKEICELKKNKKIENNTTDCAKCTEICTTDIKDKKKSKQSIKSTKKSSILSKCLCCCGKSETDNYETSEYSENREEILLKLTQICEKLSVINTNVKENKKYLKKLKRNATNDETSVGDTDSKNYSYDMSVNYEHSKNLPTDEDNMKIVHVAKLKSGQKKYCRCRKKPSRVKSSEEELEAKPKHVSESRMRSSNLSKYSREDRGKRSSSDSNESPEHPMYDLSEEKQKCVSECRKIKCPPKDPITKCPKSPKSRDTPEHRISVTFSEVEKPKRSTDDRRCSLPDDETCTLSDRRCISSEDRKRESTDDQHRRSSTDDQHRRSSTDDRHRRSSTDDRHRRSSTDDRHRRSSTDDRHRKSSLDDRHRRSSTDDRHQRSSADDRHQRSSTDDRHRRSSTDGRHRGSSLDDRHRRSSTDDRHRKSSPDDRRRSSRSREDRIQSTSSEDQNRDTSPGSRRRHSSPYKQKSKSPDDTIRNSSPDDKKSKSCHKCTKRKESPTVYSPDDQIAKYKSHHRRSKTPKG